MITIETLYGECHEAHGLKIRNQVNNLFQKHPRITAIRVDLHYPPVIDNGDTITCFPNLSPGEISRFRNSLNAKINADQHRKKQQGKRTYATLMNPLMILVKIIKLRWIHILSYDQM
ncbi:inovirus-type Gp2 protein, partial [Escherichia coli]|uniref:YagK/YfjJ domain-containing protein n=1 Tax=Escherichia coli TaxID=562 RepID=UPI002036F2E4